MGEQRSLLVGPLAGSQTRWGTSPSDIPEFVYFRRGLGGGVEWRSGLGVGRKGIGIFSRGNPLESRIIGSQPTTAAGVPWTGCRLPCHFRSGFTTGLYPHSL